MSFVGLYVSASDKIFSELEMLVERHASDGFCGGDIIFLVGEVLKGNIDFENGSLFGQKHKRGYFPLLLQTVAMYDKWLQCGKKSVCDLGSDYKTNGSEQGKNNCENGVGEQKRRTRTFLTRKKMEGVRIEPERRKVKERFIV